MGGSCFVALRGWTPLSMSLFARSVSVDWLCQWDTSSSTSFGWGNGGNVTSAGWQVILCDPI